MKMIALLILAPVMLSSCDAERRVARILEKHPEVLTSKVDTVRITVQVLDSIMVTRGDTTFMKYFVRDTVYETYIQKNYIDLSKVETRQEKRIEGKNRRTETRQDGKTERSEDKQKGKTDRTEIRQENKSSNWALWCIIIALAMIIGYFILKR